jgi:hypothetical protein
VPYFISRNGQSNTPAEELFPAPFFTTIWSRYRNRNFNLLSTETNYKLRKQRSSYNNHIITKQHWRTLQLVRMFWRQSVYLSAEQLLLLTQLSLVLSSSHSDGMTSTVCPLAHALYMCVCVCVCVWLS